MENESRKVDYSEDSHADKGHYGPPTNPNPGGFEWPIAMGLSWLLAPLASELVDIAKWSARGVRDRWRRHGSKRK